MNETVDVILLRGFSQSLGVAAGEESCVFVLPMICCRFNAPACHSNPEHVAQNYSNFFSHKIAQYRNYRNENYIFFKRSSKRE